MEEVLDSCEDPYAKGREMGFGGDQGELHRFGTH